MYAVVMLNQRNKFCMPKKAFLLLFIVILLIGFYITISNLIIGQKTILKSEAKHVTEFSCPLERQCKSSEISKSKGGTSDVALLEMPLSDPNECDIGCRRIADEVYYVAKYTTKIHTYDPANMYDKCFDDANSTINCFPAGKYNQRIEYNPIPNKPLSKTTSLPHDETPWCLRYGDILDSLGHEPSITYTIMKNGKVVDNKSCDEYEGNYEKDFVFSCIRYDYESNDKEYTRSCYGYFVPYDKKSTDQVDKYGNFAMVDDYDKDQRELYIRDVTQNFSDQPLNCADSIMALGTTNAASYNFSLPYIQGPIALPGSSLVPKNSIDSQVYYDAKKYCNETYGHHFFACLDTLNQPYNLNYMPTSITFSCIDVSPY